MKMNCWIKLLCLFCLWATDSIAERDPSKVRTVPDRTEVFSSVVRQYGGVAQLYREIDGRLYLEEFLLRIHCEVDKDGRITVKSDPAGGYSIEIDLGFVRKEGQWLAVNGETESLLKVYDTGPFWRLEIVYKKDEKLLPALRVLLPREVPKDGETEEW